MTMIFNNPLRRFSNYLLDDQFWHKRWLPRRVACGYDRACDALKVPSVPNHQSKHVDPNWRKNQEWVVFRSTGSEIYYPLYFGCPGNEYGMRTLFPVKTQLFAMRVSNKPFCLFTLDKDGEIHVPEFFSLHDGVSNKFFFMDKLDIEFHSSIRGKEITLV